MRYFPRPLTRVQSDGLAATIRRPLVERGWGLWALEVPSIAPFIGFVGLGQVGFQAHFTPAVEVGWRLARSHWGRGYATEAARAALGFAFEQLDCEEVVSFTAAVNNRSIRVMRRLGMAHDPAEDFDHPAVAKGQLRRHVLYRLSRIQWHGARQSS